MRIRKRSEMVAFSVYGGEVMSDMKRVDQIKENVSIEQGLNDLGYRVMPIDREQQFPCDLHGDGSDGKYSARVYPDSGSWYCFACGKSRDLIETYRDKFGMSFGKACYTIEAKYGLKHIFSNNSKEESDTPTAQDPEQTFELLSKRMETMLKGMATVKPMGEVLAWWEAYDCICWYVQRGGWSFEKGYNNLNILIERIKGKDNAKQGTTTS